MPIDVIETPKIIPKINDNIRHRSELRKLKFERKLTKILRLIDEGYSMREAGLELGIAPGNMSKISRVIKKRINAEQGIFIENLRDIADRKFHYVYRKYLEEFEQSKKNSKGERILGRIEYLDGAKQVLQDVIRLRGLNVEQQPNQTNVAFNWQSLMQPLAQATQPTMELQPSAVITNDPIEDQIKQLESSADIKEESISESAHITISDKPVKKRVILKASNGKNGHANMNGSGSGKYVHPDE